MDRATFWMLQKGLQRYKINKMKIKCVFNTGRYVDYMQRLKQKDLGVDDVITICCDFCRFFRKKIGAFFSTNQRYDQNFAKTISSLGKNANFLAKVFLKS
jgi:hypothetical protein